MNPKFKYIHCNFGILSIFSKPIKPSKLKEKLFYVERIDRTISLNDIIKKCQKYDIDFKHCYISQDDYSDKWNISYYKQIDDKDYEKQLVKWEKDLKKYNEELIIFKKMKKEEKEKRDKEEKENKFKLFNELKKELGM